MRASVLAIQSPGPAQSTTENRSCRIGCPGLASELGEVGTNSRGGTRSQTGLCRSQKNSGVIYRLSRSLRCTPYSVRHLDLPRDPVNGPKKQKDVERSLHPRIHITCGALQIGQCSQAPRDLDGTSTEDSCIVKYSPLDFVLSQ